MKRALGLLVAATMVFLMGCASAPKAPEAPQVPEWIEDVPTSEELVYFVGYAQMRDSGRSLQLAETRARAQFSQWKSGESKVETLEGVTVTVTRTRTVNGAADVPGKVIEIYEAADGGVYVLMAFPKTDVSAQ